MAKDENKEIPLIKIKNVRGSFMNVTKRAVFKGKEGKYEGTFLIDKSEKTVKKLLDAAIQEAIDNHKVKIKIKDDNICLKDGDDSEYDGYAGNWSLKAGNNQKPLLMDRNKVKSNEDDADFDDDFYSGAYYDITVNFWIQDNDFGKRVNANLYTVKFVKDGERFGAGNVDVSDAFDDDDDM